MENGDCQLPLTASPFQMATATANDCQPLWKMLLPLPVDCQFSSKFGFFFPDFWVVYYNRFSLWTIIKLLKSVVEVLQKTFLDFRIDCFYARMFSRNLSYNWAPEADFSFQVAVNWQLPVTARAKKCDCHCQVTAKTGSCQWQLAVNCQKISNSGLVFRCVNKVSDCFFV